MENGSKTTNLSHKYAWIRTKKRQKNEISVNKIMMVPDFKKRQVRQIGKSKKSSLMAFFSRAGEKYTLIDRYINSKEN